MADSVNTKKLDQIRLLVMGSMPENIVRTNRQPLPDSLKKMLCALTGETDPFADEDMDYSEDPMIERAARAFLDAEDDRSAASAMALLYENATEDKDTYADLIAEITDFAKRSRAPYLVELKSVTKTSAYDDLIEDKLFRERSFINGEKNRMLLIRHMESLDVLKDDMLPDVDDPEYDKKIADSVHWFTLTYKKLIVRCEECLGSAAKIGLTAGDVVFIKKLIKKSKKEYDLLEKTGFNKKNSAILKGKKWGDIIDRS